MLRSLELKRQGEQHLQLGEYDAAAELFQQVLSMTPVEVTATFHSYSAPQPDLLTSYCSRWSWIRPRRTAWARRSLTPSASPR